MKTTQKIRTLNRELVGYFVFILGLMGILFVAMMFSIICIFNMNEEINRDIKYAAKLYAAETAHYKWVSNLLLSVSDGREFTGSLDETKCDFGQFIYDENNHKNAKKAELIDAAEPIHKQIHEAAEGILAISEQDSQAGVAAYDESVKPAIEQLLAILETETARVEKEIAGRQQLLLIIVVIGGTVCVATLVLNWMCVKKLYRFLKTEVSEKIRLLSKETTKLAEGQLDLQIAKDGQIEEIIQLQTSLGIAAEELSCYVNAIDMGMGEFAKGNLAATSSVPFIGDFTAIERSIDVFAEKISDVISNVGDASVSVAQSSEQISMAVQDLAESAQNQSMSAQTLADQSEQVNDMIGTIVEEMKDVKALIATAGETVLDEQDRMTEVTQSMEQIKDRSQRISEIIETLEGIVRQTKLLALNASIEAASAGEFGRGFAVVADEVNKLADQSANASRDIADLIMDTMGVVEEGDQKVTAAAAHLENIIGITRDITEKVELVFESTESESQAMGQIKQSIHMISQEILTNSAASEENAASSQELASQAQLLRSLTEQFQVRKLS